MRNPSGANADGNGAGDPLGFTPGLSGTPLGAVPESPFGETPGPKGTPFGAIDEGYRPVEPSELTVHLELLRLQK